MPSPCSACRGKRPCGIAQAILDLKNNSRYCTICNNITEDEICAVCRDERRDSSRICVVEEPSNILVLEKTGIFRGRYHALMGALSPLDGIGPEDLKIDGLMERLKSGGVKEVIIATNPTVKGETTALYLSKLIKPLGISVSRIAYGLPVGGDIEYADENTVQRALEGTKGNVSHALRDLRQKANCKMQNYKGGHFDFCMLQFSF